MRVIASSLLALAGCGSLFGIGSPDEKPADGPPNIDAPPHAIDGMPIDVAIDAAPDDGGCVSNASSYIDWCNAGMLRGALDIDTNITIDTTPAAMSTFCARATALDGNEVCVLHHASITIEQGATLTVRGTEALVMVSESTITVLGTLDASASKQSRGGGLVPPAASCAGVAPTVGANGTGGGAGGANRSAAGGGGASTPGAGLGGVAHAALGAIPTTLYSGCDGQPGADASVQLGRQGYGGGAVYLGARGSISIAGTGAVRASGGEARGGATIHGGGGGGAGGMIIIESAGSVSVTGALVANGGGGAGGGGPAGSTGDDAVGGTGGAGAGTGTNAGGDGGNGATQVLDAVTGESAPRGGGGGGGGRGWILVQGVLQP